MVTESVSASARPESVWDYPRPPRLERTGQRVRVEHRGVCLADSGAAFRVLETSHPPVFYIPPTDIRLEYLEPGRGSSFCEWKGVARYYSIVIDGTRSDNAAWSYANPTARFAAIADYVAFYPGRVDTCSVDGEKVRAQPGGFYGGWITSQVVGPFKGESGSEGW